MKIYIEHITNGYGIDISEMELFNSYENYLLDIIKTSIKNNIIPMKGDIINVYDGQGTVYEIVLKEFHKDGILFYVNDYVFNINNYK